MKHQHTLHKLRVIGGNWRGRNILFDPSLPLRPTPNRIRETLFNWLAPIIEGARCIDLFAGSGALGIEALSRGAQEAWFIDQSVQALDSIRAFLDRVQASNFHLIQAKFPYKFNANSFHGPFDIIFLDPPFYQGLIAPLCEWLEKQGLLAENSKIYIEAEQELSPLPIPAGWVTLRSKRAGRVGYHLVQPVLSF